jgi:ferrous iron transport protein B
MLGIPVIPVSARNRTGLDILMHTVSHHKDKLLDHNLEHHHEKKHHKSAAPGGGSYRQEENDTKKEQEQKGKHHYADNPRIKHKHEHHKEYTVVYSDEIEDKIDEVSELLRNNYGEIINPRWYAIKLMEFDEGVKAKYPLDLTRVVKHTYEGEIINQKYDFIEEVIEEVLVNRQAKSASTDKIDMGRPLNVRRHAGRGNCH